MPGDLPRRNEQDRIFRLARVAGAIAVVAGVTVLAGWALDLRALTSIRADWAPMKANTAAGFVLCGISLLLLPGAAARPTWMSRVGVGTALLAAAVGAATVLEYAAGLNLHIDTALFADSEPSPGTIQPGRMAPQVAVGLTLLGTALLLRRSTWPAARRAHAAFATAAIAIAFLSLIGHLYGVPALTSFLGYNSLAVHTAALFAVVAAGVLASSGEPGPLGLFVRETPGGEIVRRLFVPAVAFIVVFAWVRLLGQKRGLYGTEFGTALVVSASVGALTALIWVTARRLERADAARSAAERKLVDKAADLARSNAELERFAYVASHDLQEPLRTVGSFTQLLARRYRGKLDGEADEFVGFIVDGVTRMQGLINDLLTYSRVGTRGNPFGPVDTANALAVATENLSRLIADADAVVTHGILPVVQGDEQQVVQLFQNLVGNAVKFRRDEPPRVHVSAVRSGGAWVFSVRDNGVGIDQAYFDRIFVIFQRLHTRAEFAGTGIGLAICKKVVERHGGRIWVDSTPGEGSTFHFSLPATAGGASS